VLHIAMYSCATNMIPICTNFGRFLDTRLKDHVFLLRIW